MAKTVTQPMRSASAATTHQSNAVEIANIGLMALALAIASVVPFELFLLSYAVLGPLHYLTEISWLKDRRFFTLQRLDWLPLLVCAVLIMLGNDDVLGPRGAEWLNSFPIAHSGFADTFRSIYPDVTFFAFGAALVFAVGKRTSTRVLGIMLVAVGAILFHLAVEQRSAGIVLRLFSIYLPTLVHVFIFTGAFILLGALKRKSAAGYASLLVFLVCGALAICLPNFAAVSHTGAAEIFWRGFRNLSLASLEDIMRRPADQLIGTNVYTSDLVMRLVRFLAFAYTYHYFNWFSKTSIIQWHAVSVARLICIAAAWLISVGLYAVNYDLGLRWLFLLSLTHVLLEFPLNHKCFLDIGGELRRRLGAWSTA